VFRAAKLSLGWHLDTGLVLTYPLLRLREAYLLRTALIFLAVTFLCELGFAQDASDGLRGVVLDPSGAAIVHARIDLASGALRSTQYTDSQGAFDFRDTAQGGAVLTISALGFESRSVNWSPSSSPLRISLTPATASERITVTANRTSTRILETPTSIVVLSSQEIAATAALATDDILRQVPGFSLFRRTDSRTANPTAQGVSLRGLGASGASRALVLADGIPLNDPFGGWVYWDRVPRMEISSIEAASGGASHLYGSDALGGVINILRTPVAEDSFSLEAAYGNENTPDLSFAGSKQIGAWATSLAGQLFTTDGYVAIPLDLRGTVDMPVDSQHGSGELRVARAFSDHASIFVRSSLFGESRDNGTPLQTNNTTIRELAAGGKWDSGAGLFDLRGYVSRQNYDQIFSSIAADRNSETITRGQRVPAQRVGFALQWSKDVGTRQNLVAGLEEWNVHGQTNELGYIQGNLRSSLSTGGRENNWGAYGEDIIRITSRLLLTLSGRVDHWQNFHAFSATQPIPPIAPISFTPFPDRSETFFSPRIALLHKLTDHVSLTASGYRSFRAPTLNELYRSFRVGSIVTQANRDLRAERLTGGEGGVIVSGWKERMIMRGNFFWSEITRPIGNVTISSTPSLITRQRQNLGRTRSRGVEFEISGRVSDSLTLSGGYELTDATVIQFPSDGSLVGNDIPQVPRNQFTFQARYSKPFVNLGVQGRFVGEQYDDDQNTFLLRRFFVLDATISHRLRPGVEVFAAAENLLNHRYDVGRTPILTIGPPILARIGVRLQFGKSL
jgi:outer membrane receptor protein involved in Fe transport